ncbi:NusG domain II-containing protein [Listeria costaricensis]|uniref:NusG domain II-containing protein n=1 Tax=Listeria costaricensis TaxID=2026604 RepID=UPI000C07C0ED
MKPYLKMIRRWDIVIIIMLTLLSFLPLVIFTVVNANQDSETASKGKAYVAVISVDNKEYKRVKLTGHKGTDTFTVKQDDGDYNTIEVKDEQIRISGANCSDQVCVRMNPISKPSDNPIICIPHKLVIQVESENDSSDDDGEDVILSS